MQRGGGHDTRQKITTKPTFLRNVIYSPPSIPPLCQVERQKPPSTIPNKWKRKIRNRNNSTRNAKLETLAEQMAISTATIQSLEEEMAAVASAGTAPTVPIPPPMSYKCVPKLPSPKGWKEEDLKDMVLCRLIPTAVADAGVSSNCSAAPLVSTCGEFEIQNDPFLATGNASDKIFRDASGGLSPATELTRLPMDIRSPANQVHMVP